VYPGPIGSILTPQTEGLAKRHDLPHASSLCHACVEVCPVKIPITQILVTLRKESAHASPEFLVKGAGGGRDRLEDLAWTGWRVAHTSPLLYKAMGLGLRLFGPLLKGGAGPLKAWTQARTMPRRAPRTLHDLAREKGLPDA
jgi:L-lactate dehydrogenase complex protein LldF